MKKIIYFFKIVLVYCCLFILIFACDSNQSNKGKLYRIAFVFFGPDISADNVLQGYIDGLKDEGFIEGQNLSITKKHANAEISNIPTIFQSLDSQGFDLIVPMTTPVLTGACKTVKKTKMVFVYTFDPIGAGAGKNFNEHLPNLTGVGSFPPIEETFKFIIELFPNARKIGTLYNPSETNSIKCINAAREFIKRTNIKLEEVTINGTNEIFQGAKAVIARNVDVFWGLPDNTMVQGIDGVIKTAADAKIPLILNDVEFVEKGALAGVGTGWYPIGKTAGLLAARVLRGEDPKNIPIMNIAVGKLVLNQEVAKKYGIIFPKHFIEEANKK